MRELPIIFSAPMVRAILDNRKSQTRRVVKPQPASYSLSNGQWYPPDGGKRCFHYANNHHLRISLPKDFSPYGQPGDLLWVRESIRAVELDAGLDCIEYQADKKTVAIPNTPEAADQWWSLYHHRGKEGAVVPSIFMPKWATRIWLEVTNIRVERLQEISEEDAKAEGAPLGECTDDPPCYAQGFIDLWNSINGKKPGCSWEDNPWVWAIEFRRVKP